MPKPARQAGPQWPVGVNLSKSESGTVCVMGDSPGVRRECRHQALQERCGSVVEVCAAMDQRRMASTLPPK